MNVPGMGEVMLKKILLRLIPVQFPMLVLLSRRHQ